MIFLRYFAAPKISTMTFLLEILKLSIPALIVAVSSYYLIREMLDKQLQLQAQKIQQERQSAVTPLRMQAYERLSILVERMAISGIILRNTNDAMQANTMKIALFMAIQQEFEHNISQQVYVSEKLWQIITATRDDLFEFISLVSEKVPKDAPSKVFTDAIMAYYQQRDYDPVATAQMAIRREAASMF